VSEQIQKKMRDAANRLHHLSMRYSGSLMELQTGKPVGLIPQGHPGLKEVRDLIDLILIARAEINALSAILIKNKVTTPDELTRQITVEYDYICKVKAEQLGVGVSDDGLVFDLGDPKG
jgi:hypothetical protein